MTGLKIRNSAEVKNTTVAKIMGRMKLSDFMSLPENEFHAFIKEIENDPLFTKLAYPDESEKKVIGYKRFPSSAYSVKFSEFREESTPGSSTPDIEKLMEGKQELIKVIRSIGLEKFKKHFIYNEGHLGIADIGSQCGVNAVDARQIMSLVNKVFIQEEYFYKPSLNPAKIIRHWRVADIEKEKGRFLIRSRCLSSARGRYTIDYRKLLALNENGGCGKKEKAKINRLISRMELVNARKALFYRVIQIILKQHRAFFMSGDEEKLGLFTQRQASGILGITPGVLSRTLSRKSVGMPWGEDRPLKDFFPSRKKKTKAVVREIIERNDEERELSDSSIAAELKREYGIILSRRSVCQYRHELTGKRL